VAYLPSTTRKRIKKMRESGRIVRIKGCDQGISFPPIFIPRMKVETHVI